MPGAHHPSCTCSFSSLARVLPPIWSSLPRIPPRTSYPSHKTRLNDLKTCTALESHWEFTVCPPPIPRPSIPATLFDLLNHVKLIAVTCQTGNSTKVMHEPQVPVQVESHHTLRLPCLSDKHFELHLAPTEGVQPSKGALSLGTNPAQWVSYNCYLTLLLHFCPTPWCQQEKLKRTGRRAKEV